LRDMAKHVWIDNRWSMIHSKVMMLQAITFFWHTNMSISPMSQPKLHMRLSSMDQTGILEFQGCKLQSRSTHSTMRGLL
jgi:hypothetical protein